MYGGFYQKILGVTHQKKFLQLFSDPPRKFLKTFFWCDTPKILSGIYIVIPPLAAWNACTASVAR